MVPFSVSCMTKIDHSVSDWISEAMHELDPKAFAGHAPTAKKIHHVPMVVLGIHHHWSADGHDKLNKIWFPIWAIRDVWSGKWLGIWVVPDNHKVIIAYLYLSLIEKYSGYYPLEYL